MTRPGVVRCLANIIDRHRVWAGPVCSQDSASMQIQQSSGVQQRAFSDWRSGPAALKRNPRRRGCHITTGWCHHQKEDETGLHGLGTLPTRTCCDEADSDTRQNEYPGNPCVALFRSFGSTASYTYAVKENSRAPADARRRARNTLRLTRMRRAPTPSPTW
eukprot:1905722-Rhodomonas_salina.1